MFKPVRLAQFGASACRHPLLSRKQLPHQTSGLGPLKQVAPKPKDRLVHLASSTTGEGRSAPSARKKSILALRVFRNGPLAGFNGISEGLLPICQALAPTRP